MYWQENDRKDAITTSEKVVDLHYKIDCKQIPTCHAWELSQALIDALPWIKDEPEVGIHQIHGASSANGWQRPPDGELIYLSKRTRMQLRVPKTHLDDAVKLVGKSLDVNGYAVHVGKMSVKKIDPLSTLFSRYIVVTPGMSEDEFLQWVVDELHNRGIEARKLLCGMGHEIAAGDEVIETRSLMITDLDTAASVVLQEVGIGPHRHLGCGIFIAHKGISAVGGSEDNSHFSGS